MARGRAERSISWRGDVLKIAFDTRPLSDTYGIGRYSRCLLGALRTTAPPNHELLETSRPAVTLRTGEADVLHAPWMDGAILHSPCPMVVTVHDLTALTRRSELLRTGLRQRLRHLAVQRAARVIAPTRTVASDVVSHLGVERRRVAVIPHAADPAMGPRTPEQIAAVRRRFGLPEEYLVCVGSLQHPDPGKHVRELACTPRKLPLVLVGATRPWAHELPDVILTGQVSDDQLAAIYSGAHALVLPSDSEGFGLPAVEALACGTPVSACRAPALVEVLGERATFVDPGDMAALIAAAQDASRPAPAPPTWSWEDCARATWETYASALSAASEQLLSARSGQRVAALAGRSRRAGRAGIERV